MVTIVVIQYEVWSRQKNKLCDLNISCKLPNDSILIRNVVPLINLLKPICHVMHQQV